MLEADDRKPETPGAHPPAPPASDWDFCSIAELTEALRSQKVSASELLEHVIARIEALDRRLNAVVVRDSANGMKLDKVKSSGRIDGLVALAMAFNAALVMGTRPVDVTCMIV